MRKKEKLSELYGPSGNFTYGKDLGYTGADSGYSSYISSKKFPVDYFDTGEEETAGTFV